MSMRSDRSCLGAALATFCLLLTIPACSDSGGAGSETDDASAAMFVEGDASGDDRSGDDPASSPETLEGGDARASDDGDDYGSQPVGGETREVEGDRPVFVELVLEISESALPKESPLELPLDPHPSAFSLVTVGPHTTLYPLTGSKSPEEAPRLYVGVTVVSSIDHPAIARRELLHVAEGRVNVDLPQPADALPTHEAFIWPGPVEAVRGEDDSVTVRFEEDTAEVKPGEPVLLQDLEAAFEPEQLVDRQAEVLKQRGVDVPKREVLLSKLIGSLGIRDHVPEQFQQRLWVRNFGEVELAGFDGEHCWQQAVRAAEFGPYEEAEEMLERVLEANPQYEPARKLLLSVLDRLERGEKPVRLTGKLVFPPSLSRQQLEAEWKELHAGTAILRPLSDESEEFGTRIEDGRFVLGAPASEYQLQVNVPGCEFYEKKITLDSNLDLQVELKP
jgi:hypothetical protein